MENQNQNDFSGIPALGDTQGLENYLNNAALAAQGLPTPEQPAQQQAQPAVNPAQPNPAEQPAAQPAAQPGVQPLGNAQAPQQGFTKDQVAAIVAQADALRAQQAQHQAAPQGTPQRQTFQYTDQERNFVITAMQRGYSLDQINQVIMQRRGQAGNANNATEQRIAAVENYLRTQEYRQAEEAFVNKLSAFGNKFGLSEQDLVTFGDAAIKKGINIAMPNVDLETVFKAIYPEQYAIRLQRMTPTNTSQIYGGTSIPEGNRAAAAKAEDAYVDAFLKQAMPNQFSMLNKK